MLAKVSNWTIKIDMFSQEEGQSVPVQLVKRVKRPLEIVLGQYVYFGRDNAYNRPSRSLLT